MNRTFKAWLREDEDITSGVKALAGAVKQGYSVGKMDYARQQADATSAAAKEKDAAAKQEATEVVDGMHEYMRNLFSDFPHLDAEDGPEELLKKFQSFDSASKMFKFYSSSAKAIETMRTDMNRALLSQKKISKEQQAIINNRAPKAANGNLPQSLITFVQKEADFFTRLLKIDDTEFDIDPINFKQLLSAKIKATAENRVFDAALALNILFIYLSKEFTAQAKTVGEVAKIRKKESK